VEKDRDNVDWVEDSDWPTCRKCKDRMVYQKQIIDDWLEF